MDPPDQQLDLNLAVVAWKTLWLEARTNQERFDLIWQPTQQLLDELSANPPPTLTCFAGKHYMFPGDSDGMAVKLFFIGGNNRVAYLSTLVDPVANEIDRQREIQRLSLINSQMALQLANASRQAIIRDAVGCRIPTDSDELDTSTATQAITRYLALRAPVLAQCAIVWLPHKHGITLCKHIRIEAEKTAHYPTRKEQLLATAQDELELWP